DLTPFLYYSGQNIGIKIMDPTKTTTESPIPGMKNSLNPRFPGCITNVLVPEPTGVKNGAEAATQIATPIATGLISSVTAIGMNNGVNSTTVEVFIIILVS